MRPAIETPRLLLRSWSYTDLPAAAEVYGDPEVMRFIGAGAPLSLEAMAAMIDRWSRHEAAHGFTLWALVERATGELLGDCGLIHLDGGPEIEVGYRLRRDRWGLGYATEAARACVAHGFEALGLDRVCGVTHPANVASQRVLQKCGMRDLGIAFYYGQTVRYFAVERPRSGA
jgi:ribosomal-protein-alanine N-acetyltransferase